MIGCANLALIDMQQQVMAKWLQTVAMSILILIKHFQKILRCTHYLYSRIRSILTIHRSSHASHTTLISMDILTLPIIDGELMNSTLLTILRVIL